jgi:hypothetical protein
MERIGRELNPTEESERVRDRTKPRKKRRFDSGPDPELVKQGLVSGRKRDYEKDDNEISPNPTSSMHRKPPAPTFVGNDKHAKRAYIGNIPQDTDHYDLQVFLNISLRESGGCLEEGNPVINSSFVNLDKRFMFVELRTVSETTCLMQLDGIKYRNHYLKIRRPVDYDKNPEIPPEYPIPRLKLSKLGIVSTQVEDTDLKLYIGGLHLNMSEEQVKSILGRYGQLKSFHLVKEKDEIISKGYAF